MYKMKLVKNASWFLFFLWMYFIDYKSKSSKYIKIRAVLGGFNRFLGQNVHALYLCNQALSHWRLDILVQVASGPSVGSEQVVSWRGSYLDWKRKSKQYLNYIELNMNISLIVDSLTFSVSALAYSVSPHRNVGKF